MKKTFTKKIILTGLAVISALSMMACGSNVNTVTETTQSFEAEALTKITALESTLTDMEDKNAIRELVDEFSNLADLQDAESQGYLFTEDAEVVINFGGNETTLSGRESIVETFHNTITSMDALYHMNGQVDITLNGDDTATGTVYCRVALINTIDGTTSLSDEAVIYNDEYVKIDGKWYISRRYSNFIFFETHEMAQ